MQEIYETRMTQCMFKLSIITINYNNAEGLRKTLASVASQTYPHIEHIIVDGGSTDESVEMLRAYPQPLPKRRGEITEDKYPTQNPAHKVIWVSEKDNGIYNAMNKGLEIALGRRVVTDDHTSLSIANQPILNPSLNGRTLYTVELSPFPSGRVGVGSDYIQILNSGDILAAPDVTERMMAALEEASPKSSPEGKDYYEPTPNPLLNQPILNPSLNLPTPNPFLKEGECMSFAKVFGAHTADSMQYDLLKENAKNNRNNPTEAESVLWDMLKGNNLGYHFRRQHIILDYIVDFICLDKGLVIELDGGYHNDPEQKEYDAQRTAHLQRLGYTELRFKNEELLCDPVSVIAKITETLKQLPSLQGRGGDRQSLPSGRAGVGLLYGNMTKVNAAGQIVGKSGYTEYSLRQFYSSTLNHDCAYIRKDLFDEYGLYDEKLKIVSDWKWYLQAIGLGRVKPEYVDIDVTIFDDGGISETNLALRNQERRQVLEELLPPAVLWDYDTHAFEMEQMNRLRRWKLYPLVYFMERVLFKLEKWGVLG